VYTALSLKLKKHKINELTAQNEAVIKYASKTAVKNIHVTHIMLLNHVAVHRILCPKKIQQFAEFLARWEQNTEPEYLSQETTLYAI